MNVFSYIKHFVQDTRAAVTVDWVVLTAAMVTIGIAVVLTVKSGADTSAGTISTGISSSVLTALS